MRRRVLARRPRLRVVAKEDVMRVSNIMTHQVALVRPDDTIQMAAEKMREIGSGALPVAHNDRLVGMITDCDIAMRAIALGRVPADCLVADVMSPEIKYCYDDEAIEDLARNMKASQIKRLAVLNRGKRLVGLVSLGDLALAREKDMASKDARPGISRPA
jgi:CBS domain-containing protein